MTAATFARIQHYGDMKPDPRTATCEQHRVASPYSDTAKGDGVALTCTHWKCVVCPLPDADLIGTEVIVRGYPGETLIWAGPDADRDGWTSRSYSLRGEPSTVKCTVDCIAPADTPVNDKDPRIIVGKIGRKRDYQDTGLWLVSIQGLDWKPTARKTRKEALAHAAHRLAIADYHAARTVERAET